MSCCTYPEEPAPSFSGSTSKATPSLFRPNVLAWKTRTNQVCSCSTYPQEPQAVVSDTEPIWSSPASGGVRRYTKPRTYCNIPDLQARRRHFHGCLSFVSTITGRQRLSLELSRRQRDWSNREQWKGMNLTVAVSPRRCPPVVVHNQGYVTSSSKFGALSYPMRYTMSALIALVLWNIWLPPSFCVCRLLFLILLFICLVELHMTTITQWL